MKIKISQLGENFYNLKINGQKGVTGGSIEKLIIMKDRGEYKKVNTKEFICCKPLAEMRNGNF
jgi:hypothetical protein